MHGVTVSAVLFWLDSSAETPVLAPLGRGSAHPGLVLMLSLAPVTGLNASYEARKLAGAGVWALYAVATASSSSASASAPTPARICVCVRPAGGVPGEAGTGSAEAGTTSMLPTRASVAVPITPYRVSVAE